MNRFPYTLVILKPDGFRRGLFEKVFTRLNNKYHCREIKVVYPRMNLIKEHYKEHKGKDFYEPLCKFMVEGNVIAMIWQGDDVIQGVRTLVGNRNIPDTIRGDYMLDSSPQRENVIHASDSEESARFEINLWFGNQKFF